MKDIVIAALAYILPSFPVAFLWHLIVFKDRYRALEIYREDVMPSLGLASMLIQGVAFALVYVGLIAPMDIGWLAKATIYFAFGGLLSWSFTTLAWVAKAPMTSKREFLGLESGFTVLHWVVVALLTALLV